MSTKSGFIGDYVNDKADMHNKYISTIHTWERFEKSGELDKIALSALLVT